MAANDKSPDSETLNAERTEYQKSFDQLRQDFRVQAGTLAAGTQAVQQRSDAVDQLVSSVWATAGAGQAAARKGLSLVAMGGYGRRQLFPFSDVDLLFLLDAKTAEAPVKETIRRASQALWDSGLRVAAMTRSIAECERFDPENVEFTLSLLDARFITGAPEAMARLTERTLPRLLSRDRKPIAARLLEVIGSRHAKYGNTLFHLEPNVKDCPGGLRDAHVCGWLEKLGYGAGLTANAETRQAHGFMTATRVFLHLLHGRDNNVLNWEAQDEAAAMGLALETLPMAGKGPDAAYWMRLFFRHARVLARAATAVTEQAGAELSSQRVHWKVLGSGKSSTGQKPEDSGFSLRKGRLVLAEPAPGAADPAINPLLVLDLFAAVAATGAAPSVETEIRLEAALPLLSAELEDGPMLWRRLEQILTGAAAGKALRSMHALGLLELLLPEFHGIDALVIRDAYHRYTVDEHTFVLIDTLHALPQQQGAAEASTAGQQRDANPARFGGLLRDLPHRNLLYLAALLHDVGKGRAVADHAQESARMAEGVLARLELDQYESTLVLQLIEQHLEMSATLRRDVFDVETIRTFAARVSNPELLRMLTLFTFADISAVHPDALTPWKAENLWRLYIATANYLDRSVDEERVGTASDPLLRDVIERVQAPFAQSDGSAAHFLQGFPRRYLQTRTAEQIRQHLALATKLGQPDQSGVQLQFNYAPGMSQLTLITRDRPMLFSQMTGVLAAWGMNVLTADAFSNAEGVIVDSFSFTDTFKTLEMNLSERGRFLENVEAVVAGRVALDAMLTGRRRSSARPPRVRVETLIDFDDSASHHSTLMQVVAPDVPGLLRVLALTLADCGANIEVALIDTEGERAIDVFYLTHARSKLPLEEQTALRQALLAAIAALLADRYN